MENPCQYIGKNFLDLLRSSAGLTLLLVAYSFAGAALFQFLEGGHEDAQKTDISKLRNNIVESMIVNARNLSLDSRMLRSIARQELHQYEGELYEAFSRSVATDSNIRQWDFWGSFLFCATVYTTIGYGHIAPATDMGRIACILYAIIGIPLCLIVLADVGKLFTRGLKYGWSFVRRFQHYHNVVKPELAAAAAAAAAGNSSSPAPPVPTTKTSKQKAAEVFVVDDEFNLPPVVAIAIAVVYIFLGSLLYMQWENWTYLEAFYFLFVSVSTIGFGDVLPDHPKYFLATSLYILIGLSLVAMVINVVMEAVGSTITKAKATVVDVGKTIGLPLDQLLSDEEELLAKENAKKASATKNGTKK